MPGRETGPIQGELSRHRCSRGADLTGVLSLRSLAISLLRLDGHMNITAANRHHARDPQRTLKLLQAA